jgi:hypothetical protein
MANREQIRANRLNGQLSKGPASEEGKAASARNSMKHGLLSRPVLLPDENAKALAELRESFWVDIEPVGARECMLVEWIVRLTWRLDRIARLEAAVLTFQHFGAMAERSGEKLRGIALPTYPFKGALEERLLKSYRYSEVRTEQRQHEAELESDSAIFGAGFVRDSGKENAISKLARYQTLTERSLYRAFDELEKLQVRRQHKKGVPAPAGVDIDASGAQRQLVDPGDSRPAETGGT